MKDKFKIVSVLMAGKGTTVYEAWDKKKNCWCYLEVPNTKSSWEYNVTY